MSTESFSKLIVLKDKLDFKSKRILGLIEEKREVEHSIVNIKHLKLYSGCKIFTGASGKIGEEDKMLRTVKLSTLSACVAVPDLLLELAEKKLEDINKRVELILLEKA